MPKAVGKQTTLHQSWGYYNGGEVSHVRAAQPGSSNTADVVSLESDDEDDENLLLALDESMRTIEVSPEEIITATDLAEIPEGYGGDPTESLEGFDETAGRSWIFPLDFTLRRYQFNIAEAALLNNTLVSLPTGLGKTFIAAVVMYNFYRWYPQGKIIFMAPTKPLVAQQIEACYKSMGIPQSDMSEMTGALHQAKRKIEWETKRIFFLTPQVMMNDLLKQVCRAKSIKCLVIDEAHKAMGNHAYCQVVRELMKVSNQFRILALSATPGTDLRSVQQILSNLLIARMELRSEESPDVSPYCHERNVQTIVLSIGEDVSTLRDNLASVLEKLLEKLERMKIIHHRPVSNWSMFALLKAREVIRKGAQNGFNPSQRNMVEGIFAQLMSLYHAYELLMSHGIRSFYNYVKERLDPRSRGTLMSDENFRSSYDYLAEKFVPGNADESNANIATDMSDGCANHPKIVKLKEILMEHFQGFSGDEKDTRVMVFAQYRESVNEICVALEKLSPTVKPLPFVGQSAASKNNKGISQKEQLKNVEKFKSGEYNTLVSTCIGEEGLDIGEVDLIVCYDSPTSPIRLVQRMGRTGRARQGKIIVLLTEGKEEQRYNSSLHSKKSIYNAIGGHKNFLLYEANPRMVPKGMTPVCVKMRTSLGVNFQAKTTPKRAAETCSRPAKRSKKAGSAGLLSDIEWTFWEKECRVPLKDQHQIKTIRPVHMRTLLTEAPDIMDTAMFRLNVDNSRLICQRLGESRIQNSARTSSLLTLMEIISHWKSRDPGAEIDCLFKETSEIGRKKESDSIRRFCQPNMGPAWNPRPKTGESHKGYILPTYVENDFMVLPQFLESTKHNEEIRRISTNPLINVSRLIDKLDEMLNFGNARCASANATDMQLSQISIGI